MILSWQEEKQRRLIREERYKEEQRKEDTAKLLEECKKWNKKDAEGSCYGLKY